MKPKSRWLTSAVVKATQQYVIRPTVYIPTTSGTVVDGEAEKQMRKCQRYNTWEIISYK